MLEEKEHSPLPPPVAKKVEVETADYEDETKAAVRRLLEAWKRALDATIEVPDREPAINAPPSCRGRREREREGGGSREKIEEERSRNAR